MLFLKPTPFPIGIFPTSMMPDQYNSQTSE